MCLLALSSMTNINDDTTEYEAWLAKFAEIHAKDLAYKHARMSDAADPFPFFRATYYRWLRQWKEVCPDLDEAPRVLGVGDLHVENFGTWRDQEGRLAWGVNDFDEAAELPYTIDLVRLACSVRFARVLGPMEIKNGPGCRAIVQGYRDCLEQGGHPFILEERHPELRALATIEERDPVRFWKKLTRILEQPEAEPPASAKTALARDLPVKKLDCQFRFRTRVGMGSLGKPRYVAIAEWAGGWVAREVKIITPPASRWLEGKGEPSPTRMAEIVRKAIRCHDPFYRPEKGWVARRLAPRCSRIELTHLGNIGDQETMLKAMGAETANIHLGSIKSVDAILKDLDARPEDWLKDAARQMYRALREDWLTYREGMATTSPDGGE